MHMRKMKTINDVSEELGVSKMLFTNRLDEGAESSED